MGDVFLDALLDSLKVLGVLVILNIIIAAIEPGIGRVKLKGKLAPLIGVSVGLIPQCGFSVVATELYQKRHITVGTLFGVYLATSDEALPIFLAYPDKALHVLPLLALKFLLGLIVGYGADAVMTSANRRVKEHLEHCEREYPIKVTEKYAEIKNAGVDCEKPIVTGNVDKREPAAELSRDEKRALFKTRAKKYVLHPLLHSLEVFFYIFVVNVIFGLIFYFVGEAAVMAFLERNKYVAPLLSVLVGIIPNCASSVVISELYVMGGLGFGAALGGLCMNAGLGFVVLFKNVKDWKNNLYVFGVLFMISLAVSYAFSAIFGFGVLPI